MFADPLGVLVSGTAVEPVTVTLSTPLADARVVALPK
jgi:hypothetical protein